MYTCLCVRERKQILIQLSRLFFHFLSKYLIVSDQEKNILFKSYSPPQSCWYYGWRPTGPRRPATSPVNLKILPVIVQLRYQLFFNGLLTSVQKCWTFLRFKRLSVGCSLRQQPGVKSTWQTSLKAVADLDTLSKQLMHRPSAIFLTEKKFCVAILRERRETYSYKVIYII